MTPAAHPEPAGGWWQVRCTVSPGIDADLVADQFWSTGAAGVEERAASEGVVLLAGFPEEASASLAAAALVRAGREAVALQVVDDGLDAWRAHARPERAGSFVVVPAWLDPPADAPERSIVRIEPHRAFGSGSHPTTRLVVADLERMVAPGARVLDVGCGTGVLSVVAVRLGAEHALGIDVDPAAVAATADNAERNGVADRVRASSAPIAAVADAVAGGAPPFDLVAANLLAPIVAELAPALRAVLAPAGALVVSGILTERWEATAAALAPLEVADRHDADGWCSLVLRPAGAPR
jgi:ribosomal protein L11 methyltransferase